MKQSFIFALLIGVAIFTATAAQSQQLLLAIEKVDLERAQEYLVDDFSLYAILERDCLIGTSSRGTVTLRSCHIPYRLISRDMKPEGYYLVTLPPFIHGLDFSSLDNILYRQEDVAVVGANRQQAELLSQKGFELVSLMPLAIKERVSIHRGDLILKKRSADGLIEKLVREVSADSIECYLRALEGFVTRYSPTDSCWSAGQWIYDKFQSFGVDASFHYYDWDGNHWRNVIGTIPGKSDSTVIVVICGHFDSISHTPWDLAPGAEDNGSGTAVVIEAARVLGKENHPYTLRFICFSGEEQGLVGSYYYATEAFTRGDNIAAAMNFDMVGYTDDYHWDLWAGYDSNSIWLGNMMLGASRFSQLELFVNYDVIPASDHWPFQQYGYSATFATELSATDDYPFYHSIHDTVGNLNMEFLAEVAKMGVVSMAMVGNGYPEPSLPPESVYVRDAGVGGTVQVEWTPSLTPDILGYNVYYGFSSRRYEKPVYAGDTTNFRLGGLQDDTVYFVSVTAIDNDTESGYSMETDVVPGQTPHPPESLRLVPTYLGMDLFWGPNSELDLAGYNVYRSTDPGGPYQSVNPALVADTTYCDSGLTAGLMHYYVITAVDTTELEGRYSEEVGAFPMSFDHGILLVDGTQNEVGPLLVPDSIEDKFYQELLAGYEFYSWDCDSNGSPTISTMGLYSTLIWRAENPFLSEPYLLENAQNLGYYLAQGGQLWLIGWWAIRELMAYGSYPFTFAPGDWPYDYLHLSSSDNTGPVG
ncbi:M28 family peptidase, partial [candidate division TA06 bacterium]